MADSDECGLQRARADGVSLYGSDSDRGARKDELVEAGGNPLGKGFSAGPADISAQQHEFRVDDTDYARDPGRHPAGKIVKENVAARPGFRRGGDRVPASFAGDPMCRSKREQGR